MKLTVGRGMNARVTKAGEAAKARFDALVIEHLKSIGATPPPEGAYPQWIVETIHGRMRCTPNGNWIAQSFMDWPSEYEACIKHARDRGFDHWKWNFHYDLTDTPNIDDWKNALGRILKRKETA
jgi:hypothetical protein